jgi:hypothetical protein
MGVKDVPARWLKVQKALKLVRKKGDSSKQALNTEVAQILCEEGQKMNTKQSIIAFLIFSLILISPAIAQYQIPIPSPQYIPSPQPSIDAQMQQQQALQNSLI